MAVKGGHRAQPSFAAKLQRLCCKKMAALLEMIRRRQISTYISTAYMNDAAACKAEKCCISHAISAAA
jgi:hypothetical protein